MERRPLPTAERLRELFAYDPETGIVSAKTYTAPKTKRKAVNIGDQVGYYDAFGYLKVTVDGKLYVLHRVIWKLVTGKEPPAYLDHANRVRDDNRWSNLREADAALNGANTGINRLNVSGAKGVSINRLNGKWLAQIHVRGVHRVLGNFDSREAAIAAYADAAKEAYGDFANTETGPQRVYLDVLTLVDEQLLASVAGAARKLFAAKLDPTLSDEAKAKLEAIGLDLSTELARIDPKNYGSMRKRAA